MNVKTPKIYNGLNKKVYEEGLIALNVKLPKNEVARVEIINIFEEHEDSDVITFPVDGFTQKDCFVNGEKKNFAKYIKEIKHNIQSPLIVNQAGALINKSIFSIDEENQTVAFVATLFKDEKYSFSKNLEDYKTNFNNQIPDEVQTNYACNCILNYLYGEFEKNKVTITGATTFGEIAFQLLNQTLVYLEIDKI